MSEANKELIRNFFKAIDQGDPASIEQFVAQDYADHQPPFPDLPDGIEGARKGFLFADIGEVVAKGFEDPVRLYEVRWREA